MLDNIFPPRVCIDMRTVVKFMRVLRFFTPLGLLVCFQASHLLWWEDRGEEERGDVDRKGSVDDGRKLVAGDLNNTLIFAYRSSNKEAVTHRRKTYESTRIIAELTTVTTAAVEAIVTICVRPLNYN